jgi:hypothetical protein
MQTLETMFYKAHITEEKEEEKQDENKEEEKETDTKKTKKLVPVADEGKSKDPLLMM